MTSWTVVFAANRGYALTSSRRDLVQHFLDNEWLVILATTDDYESRQLVDMGAHIEPVSFNRGGVTPAADLRAMCRLGAIYRRWRPNLIHQFHAKPTILGSLAGSQILGQSVRIVNTITGLGHAFVQGGTLASIAGYGYRLSLSQAHMNIFQNCDDLRLFLEHGWVTEARSTLTTGSGIDLAQFCFFEHAESCGDAPLVLMLARLLRQKGVPDFVEVARRIRRELPGVRFVLAGEEDPGHPDSVDLRWLRERTEVEYLGRLQDVRPWLAQADLLLFPSYREGVPRVVMEAAATGLPTVAYDVPGVKEAVRDGETGFLVQAGDIGALTERVRGLLENHEQRLGMGRTARTLAERAFDISVVQQQYLNVYRRLGLRI